MPLTLSRFTNQSLKWDSLQTRPFNWSIPVAFVLFVMTILVPGFNNLFHVSNLSLTQWMVVAVGALMIVVLVEIVKAVQRALGKDKKRYFKQIMKKSSSDGFFLRGKNRLGIFLEVTCGFLIN